MRQKKATRRVAPAPHALHRHRHAHQRDPHVERRRQQRRSVPGRRQAQALVAHVDNLHRQAVHIRFGVIHGLAHRSPLRALVEQRHHHEADQGRPIDRARQVHGLPVGRQAGRLLPRRLEQNRRGASVAHGRRSPLAVLHDDVGIGYQQIVLLEPRRGRRQRHEAFGVQPLGDSGGFDGIGQGDGDSGPVFHPRAVQCTWRASVDCPETPPLAAERETIVSG